MEELQSHVDDAIFVDAVQNTIPSPTKNWKFPLPDEVDKYVNKLSTSSLSTTSLTSSTSIQPLELEGICSNCLGFYLVSDKTKTSLSFFFFVNSFSCLLLSLLRI